MQKLFADDIICMLSIGSCMQDLVVHNLSDVRGPHSYQILYGFCHIYMYCQSVQLLYTLWNSCRQIALLHEGTTLFSFSFPALEDVMYFLYQASNTVVLQKSTHWWSTLQACQGGRSVPFRVFYMYCHDKVTFQLEVSYLRYA